jgi:regulator of sigma E protease
MSDALQSLIAFIVALGVLITVHEFGHFWVARRLGVKVLRFSIGFGRPLWRRRAGLDQTEYVIAALPLGGYVKMLDEHEAPVAHEERARAFNRQSLAARTAIVAAGPLFNLAFAVIAYWLMFVVGVSGSIPLLDAPAAGTVAARAGFESRDRIVAIAGEETPTWDAVVPRLIEALLDEAMLEVKIQDEHGQWAVRRLDLSGQSELLERESGLLKALGLSPWRPPMPAVLDSLEPRAPADRAGLKAGDRILAVNGEPITDWEDWVERVRGSPGIALSVEYERAGTRATVRLSPEPIADNGATIGRIGAMARLPGAALDELRAEYRLGPLAALPAAFDKTWESSALTLRMLWRMLTGQASAKNLSGPISIAQYAGQSAREGSDFLAFLAVISISLGLLNLLPVPVLDGGHLLYYLVEFARGRPLSERSQRIGQAIGIAVLLALMSLAFYNDLTRLFG